MPTADKSAGAKKKGAEPPDPAPAQVCRLPPGRQRADQKR